MGVKALAVYSYRGSAGSEPRSRGARHVERLGRTRPRWKHLRHKITTHADRGRAYHRGARSAVWGPGRTFAPPPASALDRTPGGARSWVDSLNYASGLPQQARLLVGPKPAPLSGFRLLRRRICPLRSFAWPMSWRAADKDRSVFRRADGTLRRRSVPGPWCARGSRAIPRRGRPGRRRTTSCRSQSARFR
jgi:hypothetical protein